MTVSTSGINFRDPFVLPIREEGKYYMYGTVGATCWEGNPGGFDVYRSVDLKEWVGPLLAFRPDAGFWADRNYWAPEVHRYQGRYFMFASFKAEGVRRGTQILVSDSLTGPFVPHSDGPVTPRDWECLDGTFHVDSDGAPWMVFCHEWVQVGDGEMCAMRLTSELDAPAGEPALLFHASDAPWVRDIPGKKGLVTDGPFLYRTQGGALLMLWASFGEQGYAQGIARSLSGDILGPWEQEPEPLYSGDGGHGMIFCTFEGKLILALHTPNSTPDERPIFLPVEEIGDRLIVR